MAGLYLTGNFDETLSFSSYHGFSSLWLTERKPNRLFSAWNVRWYRAIEPFQGTVVFSSIASSKGAVALGTIQDPNDANIQILVAAVVSPPHFGAFGHTS